MTVLPSSEAAAGDFSRSPTRGLGVPIPAKRCPPIIRRGANPSRMRVPEVEPVVIAAAGAPAEGSGVAVVARRRDPDAAKPGVKCRVAPSDLGCRAHAERSHGSSVLSTRVGLEFRLVPLSGAAPHVALACQPLCRQRRAHLWRQVISAVPANAVRPNAKARCDHPPAHAGRNGQIDVQALE